MSRRIPIIGGNWKMNMLADSARELAGAIAVSAPDPSDCEIFLCPPAPYLSAVGQALSDSSVAIAAQNFYPETHGAFTGEIGFQILADLGVGTLLVGHSERRHVIREPDELIARKVRAAFGQGLRVVLCIGETLEQREAGETDAVNLNQLAAALDGNHVDPAHLIIAYEPVWAIGTGRTASPDDAEAAHRVIRSALRDRYDERFAGSIRIQYGGSVKGANAAELIAQPNVDGFLVGGASLVASEFLSIIDAVASSQAAAG